MQVPFGDFASATHCPWKHDFPESHGVPSAAGKAKFKKFLEKIKVYYNITDHHYNSMLKCQKDYNSTIQYTLYSQKVDKMLIYFQT